MKTLVDDIYEQMDEAWSDKLRAILSLAAARILWLEDELKELKEEQK